ncbi:alpha/beta hydrolase family protein [Colwellia sp. MEBiC06753]
MTKNNRFIMMIVLLLCACSEPIELPTASPLTISQQARDSISNIQTGKLKVIIDRDIHLTNNELDRPLELTIFYPEPADQYPVILFSHGNFSSKDKYDNVITHWVSHGYVVIAPNHQDCCSMVSGIFNSLWYGNYGLVEQRILDMQFLLKNLEQLESITPKLSDRMNTNNLALAGHSFGGFTAQQFGGAGVFNPEDNRYHYVQDDRISAIVALSPPGPMFDVITKDSWHQLNTPMLLTTGTWDFDGRFFPTWQVHKMSFDTAKPDNKFALVVQGADHYLGNLICRPEREQAPQYDALAIVNATTTSFLNKFLKGMQSEDIAQQFNDIDDITLGFAQIFSR